jgi:serine/threonine protein kinase
MIDPKRWREVDQLFAEALEVPAAERPAFLDAACAGDPALRRDVERLLAADQMGTGFLAGPPAELLGLALDEREESGSLGPYRLVRRIGSGGMGTVYLARREDEHYERDVAVKVIRSGLASTEAYHRFLTERQILAHLEHPGIARLYDGGCTEDGRPYLVMERVEGLPLDEYCDRHRLTVGQRLALFQKVCAAVQYAHQNLLVHRDLKPGNILVTPAGEPKLLDFGIAKRLVPASDAPDRTRTGLRMLTPSFASPEQVRGEAITTASDVYSLGVILYELLAGRRPYAGSAELPYEIERAICEEEPERPSAALFRPEPPGAEEIARARKTQPRALARRLRRDLDNIVAMALRKEPQRRYGSAAQLAQDLERHLADLPVAARPDTLRYRTRKLVRRHRAAVAAAAAAVLLVAGFVASLVAQGRQLAQERDKARYALSFLVDTFKQADPYQTRGETLTAREILDQGAGRVARELQGQPDVEAAVMDAIGEVDLGLGRYDAAEPLLRRSLALRRRVSGPGSREVAESLEHLAALRHERSDWAGAESYLRQALAIRRRRRGDGDLAMARLLNQLGKTLLERGAPEAGPEIEALHREALAIARRIEGPRGLTVAETLLTLADLRRARGNYAGAESLLQQGLAIERSALGDKDPRYWRDRSLLATLFFEAGRLKAAEAVRRQCLEAQQKLLGRDHPDVITSMSDLAVDIQIQGRYREGEALDREVLALVRSRYGATHRLVAEALVNLAASLGGQSRSVEAVPLYEEALAIRRRTLGETHWEVGRILLLLAEAHRAQKDFPQALRLARQAYGIFAAAKGPDHPYTAHALMEIGRDYREQSRCAEAEPFLRRCLEIRQRKLAARHPELAKAQHWLGQCLIELGRDDEAEPLLREARITFIAVYGAKKAIVPKIGDLLAGIQRRRQAAGTLKPADRDAALSSRELEAVPRR